MNISEVQDTELKGDLLKLIYKKQAEAEVTFAKIEGIKEHLAFGKLENLHLPEVCNHIQTNILWRLTEEIHELSIALKNGKHWRQTTYWTDINEALDEVADVIIYVLNLCLAIGLGPEEIAQLVLKKIKINTDRIRSKY